MANISTSLSTYSSGGIDSRANLDGTSEATFQQMNGAASGVIAIETVLGDGPTLRGSLADLVSRLAVALDTNGRVKVSVSGVFTGLIDKYGLIATGTTSVDPKNISPIGQIVAWSTTSAPSHWLLCNGASLLRADYPDLFAIIGTTYGSVDGTHFNVPDLRGRTIIMIDGAANRVTAASTGGGNADTLGGTGGADTHTLAFSETPNVNPTLKVSSNDGAGSSGIRIGSGSIAANDIGASSNTDIAAITFNAGGGGAHSNTQPWIALNYIIYAGV